MLMEDPDFLTKVLSQLHPYSDSEVDIPALVAFWDLPTLNQWFHEQGYTLYKRVAADGPSSKYSKPTIPFDVVCEHNYPFGYHNAQAHEGGEPSLGAMDLTGKVAYAQDSQRRHVAIKVVPNDSEEYRVLCFLKSQDLEVLRENCILPVLDLLHFKGACFAVMPRWGKQIYYPKCHTLHNILQIMQSMLKSLTFLHAHNIIHRDMKLDNMLVNHFEDDRNSEVKYSSRRTLLSGSNLLYALIDYNVSIMLPPNARRGQYRLPFHESFIGTYHPADTRQGEFDYDPFAYDVGSLGIVFCHHYERYTRHIPMLAPLLDRMITRDISKRFSAAEALQFLNDIIPQLTKRQLSIIEYEDPKGYEYSIEDTNRWEGLPADFQEKWAAYREPLGVPFTTRVLRTIVQYERLPLNTIPNIRWLFYKMSLLPRFVWTRLFRCIGALTSSLVL